MYDLEMFRGNNRVFSLAVQRDGRPLDISGATFRFLVRKSVGDAPSAAVITKTTGAGLAISDAPNGIVDITFVPSDTNPLYAPPREGDVLHSQADISLAKRLLGYEPRVSFEEGLRRSLRWYRQAVQ